MDHINDIIVSALGPVYGPGSITDLLGQWMDDAGIDRWSTDALRTYLLAETSASSSLSVNDLLVIFFRDTYTPP